MGVQPVQSRSLPKFEPDWVGRIKGRRSTCVTHYILSILSGLIGRGGAANCTPVWLSAANRATFYQNCLQAFGIHDYRRRARFSYRKLEKLSFDLRRTEDASGYHYITAGSTEIIGGIMGGAALVLAPFTGGSSLSLLTVSGAGLALGGHVSKFFGPDPLGQQTTNFTPPP